MELLQSFKSKCQLYFRGQGARLDRLGNRDKHRLKERIGF
jgi:hypothetical protein